MRIRLARTFAVWRLVAGIVGVSSAAIFGASFVLHPLYGVSPSIFVAGTPNNTLFLLGTALIGMAILAVLAGSDRACIAMQYVALLSLSAIRIGQEWQLHNEFVMLFWALICIAATIEELLRHGGILVVREGGPDAAHMD